MMVYSGGTSQSLEFYKQLAFQRCVRHAKRVDQRLYYATDFADFQKTVAYFAKVAVPVYTRMRPWVRLPGMSSHAETAERFLAISRLVGDAQRRAHGILHRACREVHSMVRDFDEEDAGPEDGLRWDSVAPKLVFFLIDEVAEALGEPAPEYGIHSLRSTPSRGTPLATLTETGRLLPSSVSPSHFGSTCIQTRKSTRLTVLAHCGRKIPYIHFCILFYEA